MSGIIYPLGQGAAEGAVPPGYELVHRWANYSEVTLWMATQGTYIPSGIGGAGGRVYVTVPGAPKPPHTGPYLIEFAFPKRGLQIAGHVTWYQIFQPVQNTPVYNVKIFAP